MKHLLAFTLATTGLFATTITPGNHPSPPEYNVNLVKPATGTTVHGNLVTLGTDVLFTSSQVLENPASGQAKTVAQGGLLTNIVITLGGGYTFGDVIFNAFCNAGHGGGCSNNGNILTVATTGAGATSQDFLVDNGQNFYTVLGSGMTSLSLTSSSGFSELKQVRFSGVACPTTGTPEQYANDLDKEVTLWAKVVKDSGAKAD